MGTLHGLRPLCSDITVQGCFLCEWWPLHAGFGKLLMPGVTGYPLESALTLSHLAALRVCRKGNLHVPRIVKFQVWPHEELGLKELAQTTIRPGRLLMMTASAIVIRY